MKPPRLESATIQDALLVQAGGLLLFDLLVFVPEAILTDLIVEFIPFSIGALAVLGQPAIERVSLTCQTNRRIISGLSWPIWSDHLDHHPNPTQRPFSLADDVPRPFNSSRGYTQPLFSRRESPIDYYRSRNARYRSCRSDITQPSSRTTEFFTVKRGPLGD